MNTMGVQRGAITRAGVRNYTPREKSGRGCVKSHDVDSSSMRAENSHRVRRRAFRGGCERHAGPMQSIEQLASASWFHSHLAKLASASLNSSNCAGLETLLSLNRLLGQQHTQAPELPDRPGLGRSHTSVAKLKERKKKIVLIAIRDAQINVRNSQTTPCCTSQKRKSGAPQVHSQCSQAEQVQWCRQWSPLRLSQ